MAPISGKTIRTRARTCCNKLVVFDVLSPASLFLLLFGILQTCFDIANTNERSESECKAREKVFAYMRDAIRVIRESVLLEHRGPLRHFPVKGKSVVSCLIGSSPFSFGLLVPESSSMSRHTLLLLISINKLLP